MHLAQKIILNQMSRIVLTIVEEECILAHGTFIPHSTQIDQDPFMLETLQ